MNAGDEFEMMRSPRLAVHLKEKREVVVHDIAQLSPSEVDIAAVKGLSSAIQAHIQDLKKSGISSQLLAQELIKVGLQDASAVESNLRSSFYARRQSLAANPPSETTMESFRASLKELHRALCVAPKWQGWDEVLLHFNGRFAHFAPLQG